MIYKIGILSNQIISCELIDLYDHILVNIDVCETILDKGMLFLSGNICIIDIDMNLDQIRRANRFFEIGDVNLWINMVRCYLRNKKLEALV
jgi:hypothetical protein